MIIEKGTKSDIPEIMDVIRSCTERMESLGIDQWNEFYPDDDIIEGDIDNGECFVLKDEGACAAYVFLSEGEVPEYKQGKWNTDGSKVMVINRLCVHPKVQGRGIAKKMLKFIEDRAKSHNFTSIRFDAYSRNEIAIKLYEGYGYNRVGKILFPYREHPFYLFEKDM